MKQKERLAICSSCTHRKLDFEQGFVCQLTGSLADFKENCKHFERDETVTDTIKVRTKKRAWVPLFDPVPAPAGMEKSKKPAKKKRLTKEALKKLRRYQSFLYALLGGLLVTVVAAVAWTVIAETTGYQGVYIALGVGLLVGLAVRFFGAGIYRIFGVLAALLTLTGSLLGYYLSHTGFLEEVQSAGYMKVFDFLIPDVILSTLQEAFVPLDLLYYSLAILLSYLLAIRRINARKMVKLEGVGYKGAPALYWLRLPLILAGILLPAYYGYTLTTEDSGTVNTLYYESGEKMSEGEMQKGRETGKWVCWHENGNLKSIGYYSDGQPDSIWHWYDESGISTSTGRYRHGVENGTWMYYYHDGVVSDSGAYQDGLKEGLWKYYHEIGQLKSAVIYKADKMNGEKILWSASGNIVKVEHFENGVLIEKNE
ncbi:MAG: toxin-antitoxin system YwqK family antitoxin [Bacteroidota bacterium]